MSVRTVTVRRSLGQQSASAVRELRLDWSCALEPFGGEARPLDYPTLCYPTGYPPTIGSEMDPKEDERVPHGRDRVLSRTSEFLFESTMQA